MQCKVLIIIRWHYYWTTNLSANASNVAPVCRSADSSKVNRTHLTLNAHHKCMLINLVISVESIAFVENDFFFLAPNSTTWLSGASSTRWCSARPTTSPTIRTNSPIICTLTKYKTKKQIIDEMHFHPSPVLHFFLTTWGSDTPEVRLPPLHLFRSALFSISNSHSAIFLYRVSTNFLLPQVNLWLLIAWSGFGGFPAKTETMLLVQGKTQVCFHTIIVSKSIKTQKIKVAVGNRICNEWHISHQAVRSCVILLTV